MNVLCVVLLVVLLLLAVVQLTLFLKQKHEYKTKIEELQGAVNYYIKEFERRSGEDNDGTRKEN